MKITNLAFDGIVPAIGAGRFDLAAANMYDTPERRKVVTYIDYMAVSELGIAPPGNPKHITDWTDACGLSTGAATGSQELVILDQRSKECVTAGHEAIHVDTFPDFTGISQALVSGRLDFALNGGAGITGFLAQYPDYVRVFTPVPGKVFGLQFDKDQQGLINSFFDAVKVVQDSGVLQAIMDSWGQEGVMVPAVISDDPDVPIPSVPAG